MQSLAADVIVIGAGAGGAIVAAALGQRGHKVALIERRTSPSLNGADVLKPSGIGVLSGLGLMAAIHSRGGRKRDRVAIFHNARPIDTIDYATCSDLGHFVTVPYSVVVTAVHEHLATLPSVQCLFGTAVKRFLWHEDGINGVELADGRVVTCRVLVGADGAHSQVRHELGISVDPWVYEQRMFFGKFPLVPSVEACNRLYVDSQYGLAYFYPVGPDSLRAVVAFPKDEGDRLFRRELTPHALQRRLFRFVSESSDAVMAIDDLTKFAEIPIGCMHSPRYGANSTLLLGDAIHNIHPIAGQGMNLSIEDAGALAVLIADGLEGRHRIRDILPAYVAERFAINDAIVNYAHLLAVTMHDVERFKRALNPRLQASSRSVIDLSGVGAGETAAEHSSPGF